MHRQSAYFMETRRPRRVFDGRTRRGHRVSRAQRAPQSHSQCEKCPLESQRPACLRNREAHEPCGARHIGDLEERPAPGVCLSFHNCHRAHALHREDVIDHQSKTHQRSEQRRASGPSRLAQGGSQRHCAMAPGILHPEDHPHRTDKDLARGKRTDQADADAPVKPKWPDHRLDPPPARRNCARSAPGASGRRRIWDRSPGTRAESRSRE